MVQNPPSQCITALLNPTKSIPPLSDLFVISHNGKKTAVVSARSFMARCLLSGFLPASLNPRQCLSIYDQTKDPFIKCTHVISKISLSSYRTRYSFPPFNPLVSHSSCIRLNTRATPSAMLMLAVFSMILI